MASDTERCKGGIAKGYASVDNESQLAIYQVDGLSGATITSRGVTNMIAYWFGENGYKDVLGNLKNVNKI